MTAAPMLEAGMQLDLHCAVRDSYRQAIAGGSTSRQAFDPAADVVLINALRLTAFEARRLVA